MLYLYRLVTFVNSLIEYNYSYYMFKSIFDTIVGKISNLNPIKHFIKYALDRTLNEFLKKQLTLEDFKNGPLNLQNIQINTEKINKSHLVSSPYVMHFGIIQNLKISLPPLSEISTQSIQISISGIQITLKPNKKFSQNFKQKMLQLHQMQKYYVEEKQMQGQISETGPVDFFKQLLKKIIMNIKVNVSNIVIKLYMNKPSQDKESPQFYVMLRIPLIYLDKKEDKQMKKNEVDEIRFNILLPQVSLHLLRQDFKFPDYKNLKCQPNEFPFKYPTVSHPSTILLLGSPNLPDNFVSKIAQWKKDGTINHMNFSQMGFKLTTDYKKKTKQTGIHFQIANFQMMVNPVQIKVISRFVSQIMEFKKILQRIIQQLRVQSNDSICLTKKTSKDQFGRSTNNDLFSSIMMSLSNDADSSQSHGRESNDMFKSMIKEDKVMRQSVRQFNLQCEKKMKAMQGNKQSGTVTMTVQFQAIQFKQTVKIDMDLINLNLYILKYSASQDYLRYWKDHKEIKQQIINKKIPCDYFLFTINKVNVKIKVKEKITSISVKSLKLCNVKLHEHRNQQSSAEDYYDIGNSIDFQNSKNLKQVPQVFNEIKEFVISTNSHFCIQQIVTISQSNSEKKVQDKNMKKYSLIPQLNHNGEDAYILFKNGIDIQLDNRQKYFKINFEAITVSLNLELIQDFLNIAFPLKAYKRLSDIIKFKRTEIFSKSNSYVQGSRPEIKKNLFQSMYEFASELDSLEDLKSQNKNNLIIEVAQLKVGFRKGETCFKDEKGLRTSNFCDLIRKQKQKIYEQQSFNKICFCSVNQIGIYLQIEGLKMQKKMSTIKVSSKVIDIGIMNIVNSEIANLSSILQIKSIRPDDSIRFLRQNTHCEMLLIFVPELHGNFSEDDIVNVASLAVDSIKIISNLVLYKDYLERQVMMLQEKISQLPKKPKRSEGSAQRQIKIYIDRIFIQLDYCSMLLQQIYLNINPQIQESFVCKISKIVGGVKRQHRLKIKLCEFKNDLMLTKIYSNDHGKKQSDKLIADSDVFFEMHDHSKPIQNFKLDERHIFFQKLDKQNFSLVFKFIKRQTQLSENKYEKKDSGNSNKSKAKWNGKTSSNSSSSGTLSQKFNFKQFHNQAIEQQGQKKIISVTISKQMKVYVCNIFQITKYISKIQSFGKYLKTKMQEAQQKLKSQTIISMDRKHSAQIESSSIEIILKISQPIILDIRPDFIKNKLEKIYSNTRSILSLSLHNQLMIIINKDKNHKQISGSVSLNYYFLKHGDREPQLNPILLRQEKHLNELGFKNILQINKLNFSLNLYPDNKTFSIKIKSILGQASVQTLCYIQLHLQHFINHHVKNMMGTSLSQIYDGDDFTVLEYDAEADPDLDEVIIVGASSMIEQQLEIEDLTGALELYQEKLNKKDQQQTVLRSRTFVFQHCKFPQITIDSFSLDKLCFRVSQANDFDFVNFQGLSQSLTQKRTRIKQVDELNYYVFSLSNLYVLCDISSSLNQARKNSQSSIQPKQKKNLDTISSLVKLEKLKITYSKQRNFGHFYLKNLEELASQQSFIIFNNQNELCFVFEKNNKKILIKSYCLKMNIGGTTQILNTFKKIKSIGLQIQRSGWKKIYDKSQKGETQNSEQKQAKVVKKDSTLDVRRILVMIPESSFKLTFQYANLIKIVDEQQIFMKQFILNEQIQDKFQIKQKARRWIKGLIKNNIGGLLSGTALNLLVKLFSQLIALNIKWLSKILGIFFQVGQ